MSNASQEQRLSFISFQNHASSKIFSDTTNDRKGYVLTSELNLNPTIVYESLGLGIWPRKMIEGFCPYIILSRGAFVRPHPYSATFSHCSFHFVNIYHQGSCCSCLLHVFWYFWSIGLCQLLSNIVFKLSFKNYFRVRSELYIWHLYSCVIQ